MFVTVLIVSIVLPGATFAGKMWPSVTDELVAKAKKSIKLIDLSAFREAVENRDYDMIIDVREPNEFVVGHVPGAINIPRGLIEFKIWKTVGFPDKTDTGKKIIIYCKTGGRASLSAKSLQDLGFTDVTAVGMKIAEWESAGYPIEK